MATISQIHANRKNAQSSSGARTEAGKAASSRNALTQGLYTRHDYVKPDERDFYKRFCGTMHTELAPETLLEECLTAEITGATWRLRRCSDAEMDLPFLEEATDKVRRSIERARACAHSLLHRSINQLRRLQTDRRKNVQPAPPAQPQPQGLGMAEVQAFCEPPADFLQDLDAILAEHAATKAAPRSDDTGQLASICNPAGNAAQAASVKAPPTVQTPRNAQCPCKSGEKYKRCCGRNAPPVLHKAA